MRRCAEPTCNRLLPSDGRYRRFCPGRACKRLFDHRALKRGSHLYAAAMKWRSRKRSHQKGAVNPTNPFFGEVTAMLDTFLREDREMREIANADQA